VRMSTVTTSTRMPLRVSAYARSKWTTVGLAPKRAVITLDGLPSRFDDLPEDIREQLAAFAEQGFEDAAAAISLIREASRMQPPSTRLPDE